MTMWASKSQVDPGGEVDVIVNVTGGQAVDVLGIMIVSERSPSDSSIPTVNGWVIQKDPTGSTNFNYVQTTTYSGSVSMKWSLLAPSITGFYTLYARTMHGGGEAFATDYDNPADKVPVSVSFLVGSINTAAPTVIISAPSNGTTLSGVVPLEVTLISAASIQYVSVRLNGAEIANKSAGPFTWSLESTVFKDGVYVLNVTARDVNGHLGYQQITVTISNASQTSVLITWIWTLAAGTIAILAWIGVLIVVALTIRKRHIDGRLR